MHEKRHALVYKQLTITRSGCEHISCIPFLELADPIELFVDPTYTNMIVLVFAVGLVLCPFISTKVEARIADECKCSNSKCLYSAKQTTDRVTNINHCGNCGASMIRIIL